jgi:hypothetical protein
MAVLGALVYGLYTIVLGQGTGRRRGVHAAVTGLHGPRRYHFLPPTLITMFVMDWDGVRGVKRRTKH